tara:strand:- start:3619 stop:4503 length:885 start_codon:yes stop_codon:yes gene_type:complete
MKECSWKKLGMIYRVDNDHPCLLTHASNPLACHLNDDIYRIFYSGRDSENRSSISYVDYDVEQRKIVNDYKTPIATPKESTFYSHGITIGNCWKQNGDDYIGFMGWQQKKGHHWRGDIGRVNLRTKEISMLLGTNEEDKVSLSYPHIIHENGLYKMWYGSTISWTSVNGEMVHVIKYATSKDCETWDFKGVAIPYEIGKAQAFSKPSVYKDADGYHMWFSYRSGDGTPYRIGYAFSKDGEDWSMKQSNLNISAKGWDKNMICYPHVFKHKESLYMLYNGDKYGIAGFGLAKKHY